ncbi:histidinol-phosphate aminotransferase [Faustovirus]|nr:histidinol-phosphate aminotransferase [Faustovirus]AMN84690.1 histidinol-phosphate aminotransferase [Faustovirus]AMP44176.1 histidinol-phosphate aminotransferase [Faustovirus]
MSTSAPENGLKINKNIIGGKQYVLPYNPVYKYKLDVIENFFGMCEPLVDVLKVAEPHVYPYHDANYHALLQLIADYTGAQPEAVIITNGSDNALKLLMEAYITPESRVLVPAPTYPHFISIANTMYRSALDYCDIAALEDQLAVAAEFNTPYDLVYISSPNIPIGYCFDLQRLTALLSTYPTTMFIMDEAYFEFGTGESAISLLPSGYKNLSVTRTFSKTFGLAGLRIGYLTTHMDNIATIKVLHNDKNVTDLAIRAAKTVLENAKFYLNIVQRVNDIKAWLRTELDRIIAPDALITGYNIQYGNFFMIKSSDPKMVCDIFAQHGVFIRNKDVECPGYIRITIGVEPMMRDVVGICRLINIKHIVRSQQTAFDLDGTLRKGAKDNEWYDLTALNSYQSTPFVITNNNIDAKNLQRMLSTHGLTAPIERVITPAYGFVKLSAMQPRSFLIDSVDFNINQIERCSRLLQNGYTLAYSDSSRFCTFDGCSESAATGDTMMPDLATLVQAFAPLGHLELVGKPSKWMIPDTKIDVYVGDTDTDYEFSGKLGAQFVKVMPGAKPHYDFMKSTIIIPDITWL